MGVACGAGKTSGGEKRALAVRNTMRKKVQEGWTSAELRHQQQTPTPRTNTHPKVAMIHIYLIGVTHGAGESSGAEKKGGRNAEFDAEKVHEGRTGAEH